MGPWYLNGQSIELNIGWSRVQNQCQTPTQYTGTYMQLNLWVSKSPAAYSVSRGLRRVSALVSASALDRGCKVQNLSPIAHVQLWCSNISTNQPNHMKEPVKNNSKFSYPNSSWAEPNLKAQNRIEKFFFLFFILKGREQQVSHSI